MPSTAAIKAAALAAAVVILLMHFVTPIRSFANGV